MTDVEQLLKGMSFEVYERLRTAVELGKWDDGTPLSAAQKESSMQLVILYQAKHLDLQQHLTVNAQGEITHLSKAELKRQLNDESKRAETQTQAMIASFQASQL